MVTNAFERKLGKGKGKGRPRTSHESPYRDYRYTSILSLTSPLDGVGGQSHAAAALKPKFLSIL
jgi:hypothetical protein